MDARFLAINGRSLFVLLVRSALGSPRYRVLVAPPFAEELNKCRRLIALTANALAASGCDVLIPDLYGTGDSAGQFGDARWQFWLDDWLALDRWFATQSSASLPGYLLIRAGTLIHGASRAKAYEAGHACVVTWQPVLDGGRYLQQFLRLRVIGERMGGGDESIASLQHQLATSGVVEIAGYALSKELADGLTAASFNAANLHKLRRLRVFECKSGEGGRVTMPIERMVEKVRSMGVDASAQLLNCEQFWATQEISAPKLMVYATVKAFA